MCGKILKGRENQELLSHSPTRSLVLIVLTGWNNCIQVVQAEVQEYQVLIRP